MSLKKKFKKNQISSDLSNNNILFKSLKKFFNNTKNLNNFLKIYNRKSKISMRLLDWFVTNYAKKNNTIYNIKKKKNDIKNFIVYLEYKAQLRAYSKKQFDPFCRNKRIIYKDKNNNEHITTVGQLNFFRWAIENKIIDHVKKNFDNIQKDMNTSIKNHYNKKKNKKRKQLSISATKQIRKHDIKIIVKFD